MKKLYTSLMIALPVLVAAQTLSAGDIAVIGFAADTGTPVSYDEFSWVTLVNLEAGTKIYFTDAGYNTVDGDFMGTGLTDEILVKYTAPAGGIPAGTVFTFTEEVLPANYTVISGTKFGSDFNGLLSFPNAGDQITVFQSTDDDTVTATFGNTNFTPIFMATSSSLSFQSLTTGKLAITPASDIDNVTNLVPGLTAGVNAIAVGAGPLQADESDNARYVGITTGTKEQLLASISMLSNWTRYDAAFGNDLATGTAPNGWTTNGVSMFTIDGLATDVATKNIFSIYPNPTKGHVTIEHSASEIKSLQIFNEVGQLIAEISQPGKSVDLTPMAAGVYFVRIQTGTSLSTHKVIKQ